MPEIINTVERERERESYTLKNKVLLSMFKNIDIKKCSNTMNVSNLDTG